MENDFEGAVGELRVYPLTLTGPGRRDYSMGVQGAADLEL